MAASGKALAEHAVVRNGRQVTVDVADHIWVSQQLQVAHVALWLPSEQHHMHDDTLRSHYMQSQLAYSSMQS